MISENVLETLEFTKLLILISEFSNCTASTNLVLQMKPLGTKDLIEHRFGQVKELRRLQQEGDTLRLYQFEDISVFFPKIKPEDAILEGQELTHFIPVFDISSAISSQIKEKGHLPLLRELTDGLSGFPDLLHTLKRSIDSEGNVLDSASFRLSDIRSRIRKLENTIRSTIEDIIRDERISTFLQDDYITKRSGRWVIPVRMDSKGMVRGVVHDVSKSGETAFIEPLNIIHLANELENLVADQRAEEIRILRDICSVMRVLLNDIEREFGTIIYLDFLHCIASFADVHAMEIPGINESHVIHMTGARHPLLERSLRKRKGGQSIVPLDVDLGEEQNVMVITGANAGGKTIAIKTIGLLLVMALSGIPIPAQADSSFPMVETLLVDIGDEQSIENNLSTFSAHISNITDILNRIDAHSLVLIDELGTGTDPEEGSALACALLKEMQEKEALVFATTHLAAIKGFVHRTKGMVNAAMEFDRSTLTPLYRIKKGEPGQSYALEIAKQFGMPSHIIDEAAKMIGSVQREFDDLLDDLNKKRNHYERELEELKKEKTAFHEKESLMSKSIDETQRKQSDIMAEAYRRASEIIAETKHQMFLLIEEMKKKGREGQKAIRKKVDDKHRHIEQKRESYELRDERIPSVDTIQKGDILFVKSLGYDARVSDVNRENKKLRMFSGNIEFEVPLADVRFKRGKMIRPRMHSSDFSGNDDINIPSKINLVGLRVEESLSTIEPVLNHASLADMHEIVIIHGVGKGLLMQAIHDYLKDHPLVRSFRSGTTEEGGKGVTVVTLK